MTILLNPSAGRDSLPIDGRLIMRSKNENVDGVAFVSGTQGVICTTFTVEEFHRLTGKSRLKPACGSAVLAIPMDFFTIGEITQNWKIS